MHIPTKFKLENAPDSYWHPLIELELKKESLTDRDVYRSFIYGLIQRYHDINYPKELFVAQDNAPILTDTRQARPCP